MRTVPLKWFADTTNTFFLSFAPVQMNPSNLNKLHSRGKKRWIFLFRVEIFIKLLQFLLIKFKLPAWWKAFSERFLTVVIKQIAIYNGCVYSFCNLSLCTLNCSRCVFFTFDYMQCKYVWNAFNMSKYSEKRNVLYNVFFSSFLVQLFKWLRSSHE